MTIYLIEALKFFVVQGANYFLLTLSMRFVAKGDIKRTLAVDAAIAAFGFFLIDMIAKTVYPYPAFAGYLLGGLMGTYFAMRATRNIKEEK